MKRIIISVALVVLLVSNLLLTSRPISNTGNQISLKLLEAKADENPEEGEEDPYRPYPFRVIFQ